MKTVAFTVRLDMNAKFRSFNGNNGQTPQNMYIFMISRSKL